MPHAAEIAVIGASLGGVVAAWRACEAGHRVLLGAEHRWLGGQFTAQGVPADEHAAIERGGACASYLAFREAMRAHYRAQPGFEDHTSLTHGLNPGDGWVSNLCIEPEVAARHFEALLAPHVSAGRLLVLRGVAPVAVQRRGRLITALRLRGPSGAVHAVQARLYIDATDTGELLSLAGLPYRLGKESQAEFGEPDAPEQADALDQQPITHVVALEWQARPGPVLQAPAGYGFWRERLVPHHAHLQFSLFLPGRRGASVAFPLTGQGNTLDLWRYRRVRAAHQWPGLQPPPSELTLVNWGHNDYAVHPLLDGRLPAREVEAAARELTLSLVHWLHTAAPRGDGGHGWPEWQPAAGVLGTPDGLAQQSYVRESRRVVAHATLTQREIGVTEAASALEPVHVEHSVGVAWYNLDIHPTCRSGHGTNARVRPFTLPLGAFVPRDCDNLLPGCKNIGVTHLANACTRVHPVEWLVGEVAAHLASACLQRHHVPGALLDDAPARQALMDDLDRAGVPRRWEAGWLAGLRPHAPDVAPPARTPHDPA
ncbi:MAG: FAD-dependent oxidoreductase [Rubrivivax sp.]